MLTLEGRRRAGQFATVLFPLLLAPGCEPGSARPVAASEAEEELEPVAITVFSERVELFMEYPRLLPGLEARFLAHVTVLATGEPVRSGELRIEFTPETGSPTVLEAREPTRDGLFIPSGALEHPGRYSARLVVTSDQVQETLALPPVVVHADRASALAAAAAEGADQPSDLVPFLLEQQWRIGLLLERVQGRSLVQRILVPGEIEAPREGLAVVSAPLAGRLAPPESGVLPRLGQRVEKGQVLAFLEPALSTSDAAQLAANTMARATFETELSMRDFDLQARALELAQARHQSEARLEFARQALARIEGLRTKDLGTIAELEAARRDLAIAQREVEGLATLVDSYARAKERLEALRASAGGVPAAGSEAARRHPLPAPIAGEIVTAEHVEGEHIESLSAVYRVLDLERVWIRASVSEFDLGRIGPAPGALLQLASDPERTFDVLGELGGRVVSFGRLVEPEARTVALRYEVANPEGLFRVGQFADVWLETARVVDALAVPEEAVVLEDGRPVAFVLVHGEAFEKRSLELGIRDGRFVEVRAGLRADERVVTRGAYLVRLASASPASFGEGHAH